MLVIITDCPFKPRNKDGERGFHLLLHPELNHYYRRHRRRLATTAAAASSAIHNSSFSGSGWMVWPRFEKVFDLGREGQQPVREIKLARTLCLVPHT